MATTSRSSWFTAPAPIRNLFKLFPLQTYSAEPLPQSSPEWTNNTPRLYVFSNDEDALSGAPSVNPTCLKWQAFFRIAGVQVDLVPSNNHASPSGSLPFLLPPPSPTSSSPVEKFIPPPPSSRPQPISGNALYSYVKQHSSRGQPITSPSSPRAEAYRSLLTQNIRPAWLNAIYLDPANTALLSRLYLHTASSPFVYYPSLTALRAAATAEILHTTREPHISSSNLLASAEEAFSALETLLGDQLWFFGGEEGGVEAGLFDAEVFGFTWLILTLGGEEEGAGELRKVMRKYGGLVGHAERVYERYWRD